MVTQRVVWTLLPNGINGETKRARASILVSPRLTLPNTTTPPDLSHFPYWKDWPEIIKNAAFKVVANGAQIDATLTSKPDSGIWKAIFPLTTFVRPWEFDQSGLAKKIILSYPVTAVADLVETLYGQIGLGAQDGLPKRRALTAIINGSAATGNITNLGGGIRPKPKTPAQVIGVLREQQKSQDTGKPAHAYPKVGAGQGLMADPMQALDLLQAYHTPLEAEKTGSYAPNQKPNGYDSKFPGMPNPFRHAKWKTRDRTPLPAPQDYKDLIDFHQIVAALCQYPELNRLCGLVVDIEFERPSGLPAPANFEVLVDWQNLPPGPVTTEPDVFPKTVAILSKSAFYAAKRSAASPINERYLQLSNEDFALVQMDVDGAGMKLKNLRESLKREVPVEYDDESFKEPQQAEAGLPSLRTAGLMLAEKRRDLTLTGMLQHASDMHSDLANSSTPPSLYAEDIIRGYRADVRDDDSKKWRSLFFRKIDFSFTHGHGPHTTEKEEGMARIAAGGSTDNTNTDVVKIHEGLVNWSGWSLAAPEPGKLIDGDDSVAPDKEETPPGLPLEPKYHATPGSLPRLRFGRTYSMRVRLVDLAGASAEFSDENVQPKGAESKPTMLRRYEPVEPPGLALVSKNAAVDPLGEGESMRRVAIRTWNDVPAKNTVATTQTARRHIVPARVGHRFAELHGVMDTGPGGALDKSLYMMLVKRDKPLPEIVIDRGKAATTDKPERYAFADEKFDLPYLPDPLAVGAAIRVVGAAGVDPNVIHRVDFYCSGSSPDCKWPNAQPFKIVAAESSLSDAQFDTATREFRIPMKKAERARVYISCLIPKDAMSMMAVYQMILRRNPNSNTLKIIQTLIQDGQHWMFTPWRVTEVIHAVQKPLITPVMINLSISRKLGDTAAKPGIESLPLHSKSTARVDMEGEWIEPVDDPSDLQAAEGPYSVEQKAHAFQKKIARNDALDGKYNFFTGKHVFANTHYRRVKYLLHATTRYKEFFDDAIRADENNLKVTSPPRIGWVPNSAPPPPPSVLYVVPTFGWVRSNKDNKLSSLRAGGGLRVYLDRPWMTTGFTEMLGVVLPYISNSHPVSNSLADSKYADTITMWGADPIWGNTAKVLTAAPPLSAFPLARTAAPITFEGSGLPAEEGTDLPPGDFYHTGLPHPENKEDILLDVAPHVVGYDPDRKLWYADIVIRPPAGTYYPFVRLALARYNPISVYRAHLSTVSFTEFQQLTPDRLVIVNKNPAANTAHVAVYGVAGVSPTDHIAPDRFEAVTQVLPANGDPDFDWRMVEAPKPKGPQLSARVGRTARADISRMTVRPTARTQEAETLLQAQKLDVLVARPDLLFELRPPLLWEGDVTLPAVQAGEKRRILVTEKEYYRIESDDLAAKPNISTQQVSGRIVYLETLDL